MAKLVLAWTKSIWEDTPVSTALAPVQANQRFALVDALRGLAVLGILAMNIVGFAFHPTVYGDPTIAGGSTGANLWTFLVAGVLFDGKMRGIFTLLFGAGVYLFTTRGEQRGGGGFVADIYYRRTLWLLLFGIAHAYLLWFGEVLYPYALMGLVLYPFRRMSARGLIWLWALQVVFMIAAGIFDARDLTEKHAIAVAAAPLKKAGKTLTEDQEKAISTWEERVKHDKPDAAALRRNTTLNTTGFINSVKARIPVVLWWHSLTMYSPMQYDLFAMMLLGMAFIKTGVLTGERSTAFYWKMIAAGYGIGLPLTYAQLRLQVDGGFSILANAWAGAWYEPARIAVCLGHVALIVLILRQTRFAALRRLFAATGQMALTNYLMQSILCTFFFNVLGYHSQLQRYPVYYVVAAIWLVELCWSPIWLRHFQFGPFEWVWRSLTYWKLQPMRLQSVTFEPRIDPQGPVPAET